jgi:hypothetical protein
VPDRAGTGDAGTGDAGTGDAGTKGRRTEDGSTERYCDEVLDYINREIVVLNRGGGGGNTYSYNINIDEDFLSDAIYEEGYPFELKVEINHPDKSTQYGPSNLHLTCRYIPAGSGKVLNVNEVGDSPIFSGEDVIPQQILVEKVGGNYICRLVYNRYSFIQHPFARTTIARWFEESPESVGLTNLEERVKTRTAQGYIDQKERWMGMEEMRSFLCEYLIVREGVLKTKEGGTGYP